MNPPFKYYDKAQFVRRRPNVCVIKSIKDYVPVIVWSGIRRKGLGMDGMMQQDQSTRRSWKPNFFDSCVEMVGRTFMQDGALCHTTKSIKIYLKEKQIPLPPDMNSIQNVWECLKIQLSKETITFSTYRKNDPPLESKRKN